jgi:hypothetical protein
MITRIRGCRGRTGPIARDLPLVSSLDSVPGNECPSRKLGGDSDWRPGRNALSAREASSNFTQVQLPAQRHRAKLGLVVGGAGLDH